MVTEAIFCASGAHGLDVHYAPVLKNHFIWQVTTAFEATSNWRNSAHKKAASNGRLFYQNVLTKLLDLHFLEINMLAYYWIVLTLEHLFRVGTAVLCRYIEETSISCRNQLDFDGRCLGHFICPVLPDLTASY